MKRPRIEAWQALLALALMWGTAFLFNDVAVAAIDPAAVVSVRIAVAAAALNALRWAMGLPLPRGARAWLRLVPLAVTGSVLPFWLIGWGQEHGHQR